MKVEKIPWNGKVDFVQKRKKYIGGTDISKIYGVNPYGTALDVWLDKTGNEEYKPVDPMNFSVFFGTSEEQTVANYVEQALGIKVHRTNYMYVADDFLVANPDRIVYGEKTIIECKTTNSFREDEWKENGIPNHYRHQINLYLGIMDYTKCIIACANFVKKTVDIREHYFDKELFAWQYDKAKEFHTKYILTNTPPPAVDSDLTKLAKLYPINNDIIEVPAKMILDYQRTETAMKEKEEEYKTFKKLFDLQKADLIQYLEGRNGKYANIVIDNKIVGGTMFDSARFKKDYPDLYFEYQKEKSAYNKISLKEIKND